MIRKMFLMVLFLCISFVNSQQDKNPFATEDNSSVERPVQNTNDQNSVEAEGDGPTDPPNPVPIDNYIPLLILTGLGMIVYQTKKLKRTA